MTEANIIADLVTIILSIVTSAFVAGSRWGGINATLINIDKRLNAIEGMFKLKLKDD
jgi:hypothetical protein